jgi:hypothetical protein
MALKKWLEPERLDVVIAVLIALVSLTTSLAAWRTNVVGSSAADANRQGLIDAVKRGATQNQDWQKVYQEAGYARDFVVASAAADAMDATGQESFQSAANTQRQYLLPGMQLLSDQLTQDEKYQKADGTFDLEARFVDLEAATPDLAALDPQASFELAERYGSEQRWLTVGMYLLAVVFLLIAEVVAVFARGGAL